MKEPKLCSLIVSLVAGLLYSLSVSAASSLANRPLLISPVGNDDHFIAYQSKRLPKWNFSLQVNRSYAARFGNLTPSVPIVVSGVRAYSLSAHRALPLNAPHWIYATIRSTQYTTSPQTQAMPLLGEHDRAASVGWQFGELQGFGMAVGYEYRDIGEEDVNSLVMGVHYYF
ncbi:hypothetical protein [Alteromonas gilva]|uniref:Outer membrane protein beta-barrel domain-containing protein n=1 Tax=Alteromonas gilva TaxID=2987522 RepID=A0ABT5KZ99_9ALTE|nr:hypothetical protein [Alteromonas gilva]MDC8830090.1 hypothetical protein [Alteromonas gilva]